MPLPRRHRPLIPALIISCAFIHSGLAWGSEQDTAQKTSQTVEKQPLNVLFIAVDDLRPLLGCYGDTIAVTPHLDRLASRGTVFQHAYCQQALCSPSRLSLLTGKRPDATRVWDLSTHFRNALPNAVTLPQLFKQNGYQTQGIGKILHGNGKPARDPPSWTHEPLLAINRDPTMRYALKENLQGGGLKRASTESASVADATYIDGQVCDAAIERLTEFKANGKPFFLAVGFRKPHLPFCAPTRYWDLYDRANIPPPDPDYPPIMAPELGTRSWRELEGYSDIPNDGKLTSTKIQQLRHGYYACVSYIDEQIGRVLKHLSEMRLSDNTIIVVWGDHGFHLGEQQLWTKANNYEFSTRVPLIVALPESKLNTAANQRMNSCSGLVELVDLYPTLAEACGLPSPSGLEGTSFFPLLQDPHQAWKSAVFSQHPRATSSNRHKGHGDTMGYAIRTDRYRYVEWREWKTGNVVARELYDYKIHSSETRNLIDDPRYRKTQQQLKQRLTAGWKGAKPPLRSKNR